MQIVIVRNATQLFGVLVVFWGLAGVAHASCDVEMLPPVVEESAEAWLDALPDPIAAPLAERGFAFPEPGFIEGCPELISALLVVERPADEVFGRLIQTTRHGEFMREVGSIDPVSRSSHDSVDRYSMPVLLTRIDYTIRHTWDATARRIRWALSDQHESDLKHVAGLWEVHALGPDRSLLVYASEVEIGPVLPRMLQARLTERSTRSIVASAHDWLARTDLALR
ncbi:MAG: SRPBCC family protein [bacterium]|nr:SRPBCC family protein [bacterium]